MIQVDIKDLLESITDLNVYPNVIPQQATIPAILYKSTGFGRNSDSSLSESNVIDYQFNVFVIAKTAKEMYEEGNKIIEALENFKGTQGSSEILIIRVRNIIDLYNYTQNTHEQTIDITIKVRK